MKTRQQLLKLFRSQADTRTNKHRSNLYPKTGSGTRTVRFAAKTMWKKLWAIT